MRQKKQQQHHRSLEIIDDLDASQSGQARGLQGKSMSMYTLDMSEDDDDEEEEEEEGGGEGEREGGGDEEGRRESKAKVALGREGVSTVVHVCNKEKL